MADKTEPPDEIEVSLEKNMKLDLQNIHIGSDGLPLDFSLEGEIQNIESETLEKLQGCDLKPIAVRFRLLERN